LNLLPYVPENPIAVLDALKVRFPDIMMARTVNVAKIDKNKRRMRFMHYAEKSVPYSEIRFWILSVASLVIWCEPIRIGAKAADWKVCVGSLPEQHPSLGARHSQLVPIVIENAGHRHPGALILAILPCAGGYSAMAGFGHCDAGIIDI
jgi:hypothetical protein